LHRGGALMPVKCVVVQLRVEELISITIILVVSMAAQNVSGDGFVVSATSS
jgi:hypothetical protein